jgi:hypothetical protein
MYFVRLLLPESLPLLKPMLLLAPLLLLLVRDVFGMSAVSGAASLPLLKPLLLLAFLLLFLVYCVANIPLISNLPAVASIPMESYILKSLFNVTDVTGNNIYQSNLTK